MRWQHGGGDVLVQQNCARALSNLTASKAHPRLGGCAGGTDALVTAMRSHGGDVAVQQNCARAAVQRQSLGNSVTFSCGSMVLQNQLL